MKWALVAAVIVLQVVDLGMTLFAVNVLGATEINPVVAAILGTPLIFLFKLVWVPLVAVVLALFRFYVGLWVIVAWYAVVVIFNLVSLARILL
jgi:hypothetical protein